MFLTRKKHNWTSAAAVKNSWKFMGGVNLDRFVVLDAVWKKEMGRLGEKCRLLGVNKGIILVKPDSSAAANEIALREKQTVRSLNKYFTKPWIKSIRTATEI